MGGVGLGWWHLFGTSIPAAQFVGAAISTWQAEHGVAEVPATVEPAHWRTDFAALDAVTQQVPLKDGQTWGLLHVPSWAARGRATMPIKAGVSDSVLATGAAGWYPETAKPGQLGNFALAAHRRTRGNSFRHTIDLVPGDDFVVVEQGAAWMKFTISAQRIVAATEDQVLLPVPGIPGAEASERLITLTTCGDANGGQWGNTHRVITHGVLTGWLPRLAEHPGSRSPPPSGAALPTGGAATPQVPVGVG
ncbi:MAG: sortase [Cellulomonadaceae bacterium]|nr:sortase [Cellulomonadaceae bacterium]